MTQQATAPTEDFDGSRLPEPGQAVPHDCVWARSPYPGPVDPNVVVGQAHKRLERLGTIVGRPLDEIVYYVGRPMSDRVHADGIRVLQWKSKTFWSSSTVYTRLGFDKYGVCLGYVGEPTVQTPQTFIGIDFRG